ncbi:MAG: hypothetical protein AB1679_03525 [Actinomycetota bacterium]|jgi:hypothetical protein
MTRLHRIIGTAATALVLALAGVSQVQATSPDQGATLAHDTTEGHGQSRGDEDTSRDAQKDEQEDSYDKGEYEGDNESSNKNDETLIDADALNTPDE